MLSENQFQQFWRDGYLVVPDLIDQKTINDLQDDFRQWVEESRQYTSAYGTTLDARARFDLDSDHLAEHPSLRRISSPTEISERYYAVACHSPISDAIAQLIGPDIRFHHSKINSKLPKTRTTVKWHQDFMFTPHTNDSLITALLMVSDVTLENGPLEVVSGSHKGPLYSHWKDNVFTGAVDSEVVQQHCKSAVNCYGPAGSVCFMHTRLLHSSAANNSELPRTLFIAVYSAEDAYPLADNPLPSVHERLIIKGTSRGKIRCTDNIFRLPEKPQGASFFVQQEGKD